MRLGLKSLAFIAAFMTCLPTMTEAGSRSAKSSRTHALSGMKENRKPSSGGLSAITPELAIAMLFFPIALAVAADEVGNHLPQTLR